MLVMNMSSAMINPPQRKKRPRLASLASVDCVVAPPASDGAPVSPPTTGSEFDWPIPLGGLDFEDPAG